MIEGVESLPEKKIIFVPKMISLCSFFNAVDNKQKTPTVTRSLGTRILRFSRETKLKKQCKNCQIIHGQTKGAVTPLPPPIRHCLRSFKVIRLSCVTVPISILL